MDKNLYIRLATTNIKKNKEINFPYIIAIVVITMMYFLVVAMLHNKGLKDIPSGTSLIISFTISERLITVITFIFMIYINSFLIKKRLKEFGLYNILGLEKKHIIYVMLIENVIVFGGAVFIGMLLGTAFGKLTFLLLLKICKTTTNSTFLLSTKPYLMTLMVFGVIYICCIIVNTITILKNKTIDLLHRDKYGEKKVKGRVVLAIIGLAILLTAYYKANAIQSYFQAIQVFFPTVLMVIVATYLLFMSGSITLLSILKNNKKFYYNSNNFISIASLIFRMKQNAVGLANICILSTMAIVTAAGCFSLYTGQENIVKQLNMFDLSIKSSQGSLSKEAIQQIAKQHNISIEDYREFKYMKSNILIKDNKAVIMKDKNLIELNENELYDIVSMSKEEYNKACGINIQLEDKHIALVSLEDMSMFENGLNIEGQSYLVDSIAKESPLLTGKNSNANQVIYIIFNEEQEAMDFTNLVYQSKNKSNDVKHIQYVNYTGDQNDRVLFGKEIIEQAGSESRVLNIDTDRIKAYGQYGGILFIGILFIIIFLTITILIIYFKQVTEGYDDRERFIIMQKVGMDGFMVEKAINRQIIIVFFMPLVMALIHLAAAANIIKSMMTAFYMVDLNLIFWCIAITGGIFAIIYIAVYKMTAKTYYKIVKF